MEIIVSINKKIVNIYLIGCLKVNLLLRLGGEIYPRYSFSVFFK